MKILILGSDYLSLATDPNHVTQVISQPDTLAYPPQTLHSLIRHHCPDFSPDLVLHTDESKLPTVTGLDELQIPLFGFFIDSHIHYGWHREYAGIFDHVFVAQRDCCDSINRHTANCSWLPLFATPDAGEGEEPLHEVSFVGTLDRSLNPERVRFIEALGRLVPLTVHSGAFARIFRQSKIVLNQSVKSDINFRVFEALASGSLLLTDNTGNGMDALLEEGKQFVGYRKNDPEDAADRIRYYLEHEEERRAIARAGHEALRAHHATDVRRRQLMDAICSLISQWGGRNPQKPRHARTYAAARTYLNVARLAADLKRECGMEIPGGRDYADLAEMCLQKSKDHVSIEACLRDMAWTCLLKNRHDTARAAIRALLRMEKHFDIETFLCAASLASSQAETKRYLGIIKQILQQYHNDDPLYHEALSDQILLCANHAGLL